MKTFRCLDRANGMSAEPTARRMTLADVHLRQIMVRRPRFCLAPPERQVLSQ